MKPLAVTLRSVSKKLVFSYILDIFVIIATVAIAASFSVISPNKRPFSLSDNAISYPFQDDTVSTTTLGIVSVVAPAVIVVFVCLICIPGPTITRAAGRSLIWRRKLWEWLTGWLGLALSLALAFFVTQGLKNLFGKLRPDFLARCDPDIASTLKYQVGGYGNAVFDGSFLVTWEICRNKETHVARFSDFEDGFRSFPSGHCSIAFAGLIYLSLFLAAKFAVTLPFLTPRPVRHRDSDPHEPSRLVPEGLDADASIRNMSAAPPLYLVVLVFIPIAAALYIASSRYSDYKHHGFDILFSSVEGIICAWVGFRWYHLPIQQGAGWAWGPRTRNRAFGIGVGVGSYVGPEGWYAERGSDVEASATTRPTTEIAH